MPTGTIQVKRVMTCVAAGGGDSSVWSCGGRCSVTDEVSVAPPLTSATVDSPPGEAGSPGSGSSLPLDGDRADVLPFRSTGGVSVRS